MAAVKSSDGLDPGILIEAGSQAIVKIFRYLQLTEENKTDKKRNTTEVYTCYL